MVAPTRAPYPQTALPICRPQRHSRKGASCNTARPAHEKSRERESHRAPRERSSSLLLRACRSHNHRRNTISIHPSQHRRILRHATLRLCKIINFQHTHSEIIRRIEHRPKNQHLALIKQSSKVNDMLLHERALVGTHVASKRRPRRDQSNVEILFGHEFVSPCVDTVYDTHGLQGIDSAHENLGLSGRSSALRPSLFSSRGSSTRI